MQERLVNRYTAWISPALMALTLLGLGLPGAAQAQQPAKDLVPFTVTLTGFPNSVEIPREPVIVSVHLSLTGQSDLLGEVTWIEHHYTRLDLEGIPSGAGPGIGVLTAANGDALYTEMMTRNWNPPSSAGILSGEHTFFITGGRGRFLGATGTGILKWRLDPADEKTGLTVSIEGRVTRPKP